MNNNINLKIAEFESVLTEYFNNLPIGVVYLILKNKLNEIEPLYYQQVQKEFNQLQSQEEEVQNKGQE